MIKGKLATVVKPENNFQCQRVHFKQLIQISPKIEIKMNKKIIGQNTSHKTDVSTFKCSARYHGVRSVV